MNRLSIILLTIPIMMGCTRNSYDFTYSPSAPKAGETVRFTNISDAGESWVWQFGDNDKSTAKNPTHIYKTAGTYVVTMTADSVRARTITHTVIVEDSIPSFTVSETEVRIYDHVTLKAAYYNPLNLSVTFLWDVSDDEFVLVDGSMTGDSIVGYFLHENQDVKVQLTITVGTVTTDVEKYIPIADRPSRGLVMQDSEGQVWRQRIYGNGLYEEIDYYDEGQALIGQANDTTATLNGVKYDIHNMPVLTEMTVTALGVDPINRKLYLISDGKLYVANANGDYLTELADDVMVTLLVDQPTNRVFYTAADGVMALPLVTHPTNLVPLPLAELVNIVPNIQKMMIEP